MLRVRNRKHKSIERTITEEEWKQWCKNGFARAFRIVKKIATPKEVKIPKEIDTHKESVVPRKSKEKGKETEIQQETIES